jgi:DNA primase
METEVQQIKDRINIVDVVSQYVQLRRAGKSYTAKCPFHKERTPSFHVSPERGTYICFGCGEKGDIFSFVQKMDGVDFPTVLKQMAEKAGIKLTARRPRPEGEEQKEETLRKVAEEAVAFFEEELKKRPDVLAYLGTRGLQPATVKEWRLGYAPAEWEALSKNLLMKGVRKEDIVEAGFAVTSEKKPGEVFDRFRGRIIFPIFDSAGQPIAVSGRFFEKVPGQRDDGTEPAKYINSPETLIFKKSRVLYGLDRARGAIRKLDCILLVEGQFDLVLCHQSGLPFAVALSGTALTPEHLSLLGRISKRLVLALDADEAGVRSGLKSARMALEQGFDVKIPTFPRGKDPADLARENPELLKAAVRASTTAIEFFLQALRETLPRQGDERAYKKAVEAQILPLIAAIESRIEQEHFIRIVAGKLGVSDMAVRSEVEKVKVPRVMGEAGEAPSSPQVHQKSAESTLSPLDKKAGMLLFYFGRRSPVGERLEALLGARVGELEEELAERAEEMRFRFEQELGEQPAETIGEEMLADMEKAVERERFKMKFL